MLSLSKPLIVLVPKFVNAHKCGSYIVDFGLPGDA